MYSRLVTDACDMVVVVSTSSASFSTGFFGGRRSTVRLGSTIFFMLGLEIKACKPPRNDLSIIEMSFLYDTWYSVVLRRPKNEVKLLTQRAAKWICMGKWAVKILADLFLKNEKASDDRTFFTQCVLYHSPGLKGFTKKSL